MLHGLLIAPITHSVSDSGERGDLTAATTTRLVCRTRIETHIGPRSLRCNHTLEDAHKRVLSMRHGLLTHSVSWRAKLFSCHNYVVCVPLGESEPSLSLFVMQPHTRKDTHKRLLSMRQWPAHMFAHALGVLLWRARRPITKTTRFFMCKHCESEHGSPPHL